MYVVSILTIVVTIFILDETKLSSYRSTCIFPVLILREFYRSSMTMIIVSFDRSVIVALQGISPFELQDAHHDSCYDSKDSGGELETS